MSPPLPEIICTDKKQTFIVEERGSIIKQRDAEKAKIFGIRTIGAYININGTDNRCWTYKAFTILCGVDHP